ncbi:MAG TPA: metallophosphoesterase family protein [Coriobacteriia bacterium]
MDGVRRIALFSDVHGNLAALDAVLEDISVAGFRELYCLGDLVGYGPDPAGVVDRIRALGIPTVQGNYDDGIGNRRGSCGCYYATPAAKRDGAASYAFTSRALDDDYADWLAGLPPAIRFQERGVRVLLAHGSPRRVNEYLLPDRSDELLVRLAVAANADVVCVGHVHVPYHRSIAGPDGTIGYVNAGAVGRPGGGDPRACWVELLIGSAEEVAAATPEHATAMSAGDTETWVAATFHRVDYDIAAVERDMLRVGLPATLAATLRSA